MARNTTPRKNTTHKTVETLKHDKASRMNIPTAEYQSVMQKEAASPVRVAYERRNRDLDPQLVWRGKDEQDWSDLVVHAPPLYIQEKVHPKVLIDDLLRQTREQREHEVGAQPDLFADFNGIPKGVDKTEFYRHEQNWSNRMILGDSLQVMASLAEREGLRGKVQCIYLDPPYGIKFNSNFQWSTTSRDVKDGNVEHITREPEQVKAFRDTWRDGIHSYLTYLRDRLTVARDLLADSGSIFVQIGDENVHRVRAVMDEVFGDQNFLNEIVFRTSSGRLGAGLDGVFDVLLWYAKDKSQYKYRSFLTRRTNEQLARAFNYAQREDGTHFTLTVEQMNDWLAGSATFDVFQPSQTQSQSGGESSRFVVHYEGKTYQPPEKGGWRSTPEGFERLAKAARLYDRGKTVRFRLKNSDYPYVNSSNIWMDTLSTSFGGGKTYVVETNPLVIQRCILMTTDPGDLVLDPTCGSGTTAYVAEQWGRRWITIDTSRVALALARARIMGARYPYYLLADLPEGQLKEAEITHSAPSSQPTRGDIRQGFVYERVPHITLKSIANNAEIDVIWEQWQAKLEPTREALNEALQKSWQEWESPRDLSAVIPAKAGIQKSGEDWTPASAGVTKEVEALHAQWWQTRIARQKEIDASIAAKAEFEYLYDRPYVARLVDCKSRR
jgi:adenine-specific DNA-methyltransferase